MLSMLIFAAAAAAEPRIPVAQTGVSAAAFSLCQDKGVKTVDQRGNAPIGAQKLNQLPNADEYLAVMRIDEKGCRKPVIVNYDIGSAPRKNR